MIDILQTVDEWLKQGRQIALATVVETWGSAPRRAGSKMAVTSDLSLVGSLSGGCVETAIVEEALAVIEDGIPRLLQYGVSDNEAWEVGLSCGGKISIFVEPLDAIWWQIAAGYVRHNRSFTTITLLDKVSAGQKIILESGGTITYNQLGNKFATQLSSTLALGRPQIIELSGMKFLMDVVNSRPHLIIIGGVHIAQPLLVFAHRLGFRVSIVDPRGVFATSERFPDADTILHTYPDKALLQLGLDNNTFIAVLTHDPKIDDKALLTALPARVPYVGVLSSRKTHQARIERLSAVGLSPEQIAQIRTPIGIDIDAQNPEEIALSIMAQIVAVRNEVLQPQPA